MKKAPPREDLSAEALVTRVADEFLERLGRGEQPDIEAYARRYPEIATFIRQMLPALQLMRASAPEPAEGFLGDFRLIREVGRGGMGVVYEAEQVSLRRRVAVKVLPFAAALDARQLRRFQHEAEAAAQLHHTHIVPVYAVGHERGVHFYAMQFIDGHSLAHVVRELRHFAGLDEAEPRSEPRPSGSGMTTPLPDGRGSDRGAETAPAAALTTGRSCRTPAYFRTAAQLGVQAAEALEHAHQQGVVHRDVKPGNLLVDGRGHLWVADFGLARSHGEAGLTLTGDLLGTLRYMSPEQALGRRERVDHRTDVYALGMTLYELLTLEPAHRGRDRQELLRQIEREEPRPPRRLNPAIPAELETVVLKAVAKAPAERYATAQELADDLRRFLEDKPVRARRPAPWRRAAKWARRHKVLVAAAGVVLAVAVVALAVGSALVWREKERTRAAYEAEAEQRRQAEHHLRLALQALDTIYVQVAERAFPRDPRREQEDRELLQKALAFYEQFAGHTSPDPAVRQEIGVACRRVGEIYHRLGHLDRAREAYGRSITVLEALAAEFPAAPDHRRELANAVNALGAALENARRFPEAEKAHDRARGLWRELVRQFPDRPDHRQGLAMSLTNGGVLRRSTGRLREAEALWRETLTLHEQLASEFPAVPRYRQQLASARQNLAGLLTALGRPGDAEPLYRQAVTLLEELAGGSPDPANRARLAGTLYNLSNLLAGTNRHEEAEELCGRAIRLGEKLAAEFPTVPDYRRDLALNHNQLGNLLAETGRREEAEQEFARAVPALEKLVAEFPASPRYQELLAVTHNNRGALFDNARRCEEAEAAYRQALALRQKLTDDQPRLPEYRQRLAYSHQNLAGLLAATDRPAEAEAAYRQAQTLLEKVTADAPPTPEHRDRLAAVYRSLGLLLQGAGRFGEAEGFYRRNLALTEALADQPPQSREYRTRLAAGHGDLGSLLTQAGRRAEAAAAYRRALGLWDQLAAEFPKAATYHHSLAWLLAACPLAELRDAARAVGYAEKAVALAPEAGLHWTGLGLARARAGDWPAARAALEKAAELRDGGGAFEGFFLAMAHWHLGDQDRARAEYRRAAEWMAKHRPRQEELLRFRAEAAALLGLPPPAPHER